MLTVCGNLKKVFITTSVYRLSTLSCFRYATFISELFKTSDLIYFLLPNNVFVCGVLFFRRQRAIARNRHGQKSPIRSTRIFFLVLYVLWLFYSIHISNFPYLKFYSNKRNSSFKMSPNFNSFSCFQYWKRRDLLQAMIYW